MRLVACQALPRVPRPGITMSDFRAMSALPHDHRVRAFYTDFHGREIRTGVQVSEDMRPESMTATVVRVPVESAGWRGTLDVQKRDLVALPTALPLRAGHRLLVGVRFDGLTSLHVTSVQLCDY
jgi:hypothetical protein